MAKPRPSQRSKQAQPESKKALIIFLVFFILTTIGAGLFGYQGYMDSEGKDQKTKAERDRADAATADRDAYQYQALLYRRYLGQEKSKDALDKLDKQFKEVQEGWTQKDHAEVVAVVEAMDKRLKLAGGAGAPPKNYQLALDEQVRAAKAAEAAITPHLKDKNAGNEAAAESKALLEDAKAQYAKNLQLQSDKNKAEQEEKQEAKKTLEALLKKTEDERDAKARELAEFQKKTTTTTAGLKKEIASLKDSLAQVNSDLDKLRFTSKDVEVPDLQVKAVGRVVERRGDSAFINLGQIQKMTPQMTFSVHGVGTDGQPLPTSKGSLEVVNVFEAGSQARILIEKNKNDPIQQGDVIVNPNWNPDRKRHVAIAGMIDLTGEGRNQLREFRQLLERQNIVVDAYLESSGSNWASQGKGVTRETNYLILGEELPDSKDATVKIGHIKDSDVFQQAKANGVLVLNLRNYLDLIGYQPPKGSGTPSEYLPGVGTPPEKKEPAPAPPAPAKDVKP